MDSGRAVLLQAQGKDQQQYAKEHGVDADDPHQGQRPAPGCNTSMAPNRIDTGPDSARNHSLRISLRKRIAATIWNTPATSAQMAMM